MAGPQQFSMANLMGALSGETPLEIEAEELPQFVRVKAKAKALAPKNIIQLAKARLKDVKVELRRMKALEKERQELERLLAAAEHRPDKRILREVKKTAG